MKRPQLPSAVLALLLSLCLWTHSAWAQITLSIDGVDDAAIEAQLEAYLVIPEDAKIEDTNLLESLTKSATLAMQAIGYYSATFVIEEEVEGDNAEITMKVTPGEPVRVTKLDFEISGEARNDDVFKGLAEVDKVAVGEVFNHGHYEALKSKVINIAQTQGYFDSHFVHNTVNLDVATNSAEVDLHFASGKRYSLGDVYFVGLTIEEPIIRHWVSFKPGTPYQSRLVADLTNTLLDSGFFANVRVVPERDKAVDGVIPVRVELTATEDNTVHFGIGFATDTGPRGLIGWDKPRINSLGHSFHSELSASKIRQSISASYKIPSPKATTH